MVATPLVRSLPSRLKITAATLPAVVPAGRSESGSVGRRARLPVLIFAAGALLLTAGALAFAFSASHRPGLGVAGIIGTPGPSDVDGVGLLVPTDSPAAGGSPGSGPTSTPTAAGARTATGGAIDPAGEPTGSQPPEAGTPDPEPIDTATPIVPPSTGPMPTPSATPTNAPTPRPSPKPTPVPTPDPTPPPTPGPTACVATAPKLIGEQRSDARRLWINAGFTGTVTALDGHGNYPIATQNRTAGASYPCDTGVTIGP